MGLPTATNCSSRGTLLTPKFMPSYNSGNHKKNVLGNEGVFYGGSVHFLEDGVVTQFAVKGKKITK